jgi:hypothetical protein
VDSDTLATVEINLTRLIGLGIPLVYAVAKFSQK